MVVAGGPDPGADAGPELDVFPMILPSRRPDARVQFGDPREQKR